MYLVVDVLDFDAIDYQLFHFSSLSIMWGKESSCAVLGGWNLIYGAKSTKDKI
jgi:hypothetical protein